MQDKITRDDLKSGKLKDWQLRIMKNITGLAVWTQSELDNIQNESKDVQLEEDYELGSVDDMKRAVEYSLRN